MVQAFDTFISDNKILGSLPKVPALQIVPLIQSMPLLLQVSIGSTDEQLLLFFKQYWYTQVYHNIF